MTSSSSEELCNNALQGIATVLRDINSQLTKAQREAEHWRTEAETWRTRWEDERCRNERLRKVLRCAQRSDSPRSPGCMPQLLGRSLSELALNGSPRSTDAQRPSPLSTAWAPQDRHNHRRQQEQEQQHKQQQGQHQDSGDEADGVRRKHSVHSMPTFVDSLMTMFVAHSILQETAAAAEKGQQDTEHEHDEPLASVSLDDDDGASGVGLAAAAAVSAAMARAWASVASREQKAAASVPGPGGGSKGRAGFRLTATVTKNLVKRRKVSVGDALASQDSQDSICTGAGGDSTGSSPPSGTGSLLRQLDGGPQLQGQPDRAASGGDVDCGVCGTERGSPAHIALHWLSKVRTVLAVRKLSPNVDGAFHSAVAWLRHQGISVYVEPSVYEKAKHAHQGPHGPHLIADDDAGIEPFEGLGPTSVHHDHAAATSPRDHHSQRSRRRSSETGDGRGGSCSRDTKFGALLTWQQRPEGPGSHLIPDEVANVIDLVVVLGGDGTVLWTCHMFGNRGVPPIVPYSMGSLGFLTPFQPHQLKSVLRDVLKGGFPIQLRHRLHCTVVRAGSDKGLQQNGDAGPGSGAGGTKSLVKQDQCGCLEVDEHVVLNEVVVDRGISPFLTNLACYCDGNLITHVQGDGLIVATPTGSTAYNLAANGSMVHPQVPGVLFTPICPHSLSFRPLVLPDFVQLCIQVPCESRSQVWCSFDGKDRTELRPGDAVVMRLSKWPVPTVCSLDSSKDWFCGVRDSLHWNVRKMQGGPSGG